MVTGIAHICLSVKNLDSMVNFYVEKLGMKRAFDFKDSDGNVFGVYIHIGHRSFLEMFKGREGECVNGGKNEAYQHICLEVSDLPGTIAAMRTAGAMVSDPIMGGDNSWQALTEDPEGNRIELHCYTPESMQTPFLQP